MRLSRKEMEELCKKLNTDRLLSYSRLSTFKNCKLEYKLSYIDRLARGQQGFYSWFGSLCHDIKQWWLQGGKPDENGNITDEDGNIINPFTYDDMILEFITETERYKNNEFEVGKCPGTRGATSEENRDKLFSALEHYFINTIPMEYKKIKIEPLVMAKVGGSYFQGYIDELILTMDDKIMIVDDKTSSASGFSGKSLKEKAAQLYLYALALMQMKKLPIENIVLVYDMMRYVHICFEQKNGKIKKTRGERQKWVSAIAKRLEKELVKECGFDEADAIIAVNKAVMENSLESLPKEISSKYTIENCYIEVELDKALLMEQYANFRETLEDLKEFETETPEKIRGPIEPNEEFYCNNLCDMRSHCPWYNKMKNDREQEDLFSDVGAEDPFGANDDPFAVTSNDPFGGSFETSDSESDDQFFSGF